MKHDYENMSDWELELAYDQAFGRFFARQWDDEYDHRQEIIDCIESGVPQDVSKVGVSAPEGCVL